MIEYFIIFSTVVFIYSLFIKPYRYWKDKNVPHETAWPILGSLWKFALNIKPMPDIVYEMYNKHSSRYFGLFSMTRPILVLKDIDLIKQITIKDFDQFTDHQIFIDEDADPLFGKNLFSLKGQKWRDMRSTLSPAFTGSKMRSMFNLISDCAEQFSSYFIKKVPKDEILELDMKQVVTRFANDVIATTAFGIKVDSLEDQDNEFYTYGKSATNFAGVKNLLSFGFLLMPKVMKALKFTLFTKGESNFFRRLILDTMKVREEKNIVRNDMIQLLMQARKGQLKHEGAKNNEDAGFATVEESNVGKNTRSLEWNDDDIVAQAVLFFLAGFETISTSICFTVYELALNPDIQKKLQEEIDDIKMTTDKKNTYDAILKMKYLDMVISETLRKWPPVHVIDRMCTSQYVIRPENSEEKPVVLNKDDTIWLPIYSIHRDEQYYPNPEKYDPERFSDENKSSINPFSYLPFGIGPRNCIGSRFALLEAKVFLYHLLSNFEVVVTKKTQIPLKFAKNQFNVAAKDGYWIGLKQRK